MKMELVDREGNEVIMFFVFDRENGVFEIWKEEDKKASLLVSGDISNLEEKLKELNEELSLLNEERGE